MTEISLVQVTCPDCKRRFDVPDGAAEAQCPQCGSDIVWRSCLDTGEVFTVLKRWETWLHPNCNIRHIVDLTQVIQAPATPAPVQPEPSPVPADAGVYTPTELAPDVDWPDQAISGRLIVDSDRLAILPAEGALRPPLSVAWLRDVVDYSVSRNEADEAKKPKRFGRGAKKAAAEARPSILLFAVPGGHVTLQSSSEPDVLLSRLDEHLRPRLTGGVVPAAPPAPMQAATPPVSPGQVDGGAQVAAPTAPDSTAGQVSPTFGTGDSAQDPASLEMPDLEPDTPEGIYESIRKLAELAVVGAISSDEFADKKARLLARL